jgi:hypothetical protein
MLRGNQWRASDASIFWFCQQNSQQTEILHVYVRYTIRSRTSPLNRMPRRFNIQPDIPLRSKPYDTLNILYPRRIQHIRRISS